jgi:two-component system, OmpR family, alkaline phosphatase synthesis response regulator PhoP
MTRILLVEDEPSIAAGVRDDLEFEGHSVDVVTDGETATARGLQGQYDLILLDVMLPQKDGFTVCRELRAAGVRTPVLMLTARGQEVDKVLGLELGADDYITKPFSRRELQSRVKAALRRTAMNSTAAGEIYEFGDLKIDFARCEVWKRGQAVDVTALELKLLRALIDHRGRVLTIDQLNEAVWGKDVFITNRVVYTHMNNLRKKIEIDPQTPRHLITVRGIGYRFDS